jgi:thiamine biosynthesis lipoprotein
VAAVVTCCTSLALGAAPAAPPLSRFEFNEPHMGTTFTVVLYASDAGEAARASRAAFSRIQALDVCLTDYNEHSEAMRLTREAVGRAVPVSADLYRVLVLAQAMSVRTGGAFDVTVGALSHLWRRARRQSELPDEREVDAARQVSGFQMVRLDPSSRSVLLARAGMRLDFGGVAKGYAADRALEVMRAAGVRRALVAAGGDVAVGDPPPGEDGWRVAVAPLDAGTAATRSLTLAHAGVSTSGEAEQWLEIGGVRYSHILDARTGRPLTGQRQTTVVARDATTSDMLATTLCVLGAHDGLRLADVTPGVAAMMAERRRDGQGQYMLSHRWKALRGD